MIDLIKAYSIKSSKLEEYINSCPEMVKITKRTYNLDNNSLKKGIGNLEDSFLRKETQLFNLNLKITNNNRGYIENSLHTFFNRVIKDEHQNYDDFHFCDLVCSINILEEILNVNLEEFTLQNLEIGFNIDIGSCPTQFLEENLLMYKLKEPCVNQKNDKTFKQKVFIYQNYKFKIYDKSLESKTKILNPNILRIEIKYLTSKEFNKFHIYNIGDLRDLNKLNMLFDDFMKKFEELTIVDAYKGNNNTSRTDKSNLIQFTNPNYWIDTRNNRTANTMSNRKKKFEKILIANNLLTTKNRIRELIIEKHDYLANPNCTEDLINESLIA